jgi:hypothetical protein
MEVKISSCAMRELLPSPPTDQQSFDVRPRWPEKAVRISESAFEALNTAQHIIHNQRADIQLILTRGDELNVWVMRAARRIGRKVSALLFRVFYRERSQEANEIFSSNGHDDGTGNHIDLSIEVNGKHLKLLFYGAFTSVERIEETRKRYKGELTIVYDALKAAGFVIHNNAVEALQIHCDLCRSGGTSTSMDTRYEE